MNDKSSIKPHFQSFVPREGFAHLEISLEDFTEKVRVALPDKAFSERELDLAREDVEFHLAKAIGQFRWNDHWFRRAEVMADLSWLSDQIEILDKSNVSGVAGLLQIGRLRNTRDTSLVNFIILANNSQFPDFTEAEIRELLFGARGGLDATRAAVRNAQAMLNEVNGSGQPPQLWYREVVDGLLSVARQLSIPLSMYGNPTENQHLTPFTSLAFSLESFLPTEMQSNSLAACVKRIERSGQLT